MADIWPPAARSHRHRRSLCWKASCNPQFTGTPADAFLLRDRWYTFRGALRSAQRKLVMGQSQWNRAAFGCLQHYLLTDYFPRRPKGDDTTIEEEEDQI